MRKKQRTGRGIGSRVVSALLTATLVLGLLAFAGIALGPHLLGYRTQTMLTGSMAPEIVPGDVVVSVPKAKEDVAVGDVITYHIPVEDQRVETHRVVEVVRGDDGSVAVRTKGDANDGVDPWLATLEGDTVWETKVVVPYVGRAIRALRTPVVQDYGLWVALGLGLVLGLSMIWARGEEEDDALVGAAPRPVLLPAATTPTSSGPSLDATALAELADDSSREIATRFAARYTEMLPQRIDKVLVSVRAEDAETALESVLSLKVSSRTVGTSELADLAATLESSVMARDWVRAHAVCAGLGAAADRAEGALADHLAT